MSNEHTLSDITYLPTWTRNGSLHWTPRETQRLMNSWGVADKEGLKRLFPDRTWKALTIMASKLGLTRKKRLYTEEELHILCNMRLEGYTYKEIAERLDRTPLALETKMCLLQKQYKHS